MSDKVCHACQNTFTCLTATNCWCSDQPSIFEPDPSQDCLCPTCLTQAIADKVNENPKALTKAQRAQLAEIGTTLDHVKGVDFNMVMIGGRNRFVFTAFYLLKRGYCCQNHCRNCPYREL